jgi:hypothetical protein
VTRHDDHGHRTIRGEKLGLEIKAVRSWKLEVQQQTAAVVWLQTIQKGPRGGEGRDVQTGGSEQIGESRPQAVIVIDHMDSSAR